MLFPLEAKSEFYQKKKNNHEKADEQCAKWVNISMRELLEALDSDVKLCPQLSQTRERL